MHSLIDDASISAIVNADIAAGAAIESSKIAFSLSDYVTIAGDQTVTGLKTFSQAPVFSSPLGDGNLAQLTTLGKVSGSALGYLASANASAGALPIANGGTGKTTAQAAIDALTAVSSATNEHVLTKDTATGNAIFKAASTFVLSCLASTSGNTIITANTERSSKSTSYVKVKEVTIPMTGTISVSFDLKSYGDYAYGRIYKNGTAVGTERKRSPNTYETYTETISISSGDLIQLYIHGENGGSAYAQNFILKAWIGTVNTD